jgi:hypothetical protein
MAACWPGQPPRRDNAGEAGGHGGDDLSMTVRAIDHFQKNFAEYATIRCA